MVYCENWWTGGGAGVGGVGGGSSGGLGRGDDAGGLEDIARYGREKCREVWKGMNARNRFEESDED